MRGAVSFKRLLGSHPSVPNLYHIGASFIGIGGSRKSSSLPESAGSVMRKVCDTYPITAAQSAPGGDPRVFRVDGTEIALRRETALHLILKR